MVALALLWCESSVLASLLGRWRGLSLAVCLRKPDGFPTPHHHSVMLMLLSRRSLCSMLSPGSYCTDMLFSKAVLLGGFVMIRDHKKQPLSPPPAKFIK